MAAVSCQLLRGAATVGEETAAADQAIIALRQFYSSLRKSTVLPREIRKVPREVSSVCVTNRSLLFHRSSFEGLFVNRLARVRPLPA